MQSYNKQVQLVYHAVVYKMNTNRVFISLEFQYSWVNSELRTYISKDRKEERYHHIRVKNKLLDFVNNNVFLI